MREHDDLNTVIGHTLSHSFVGRHHATTKILILTTDSQTAPTIPNPIGELRRRILAQPSDEELQNFFIFHRVAIGRVGYVNIVMASDRRRRLASYYEVLTVDWKTLVIWGYRFGKTGCGPGAIGE